MTMAENIGPAPDPAQIAEHLETITARWHELPEPARLEMRALGEQKQPQVMPFDPSDISGAVEAAEARFHASFYFFTTNDNTNDSNKKIKKDNHDHAP
jgi:hypothetical protein